MLAAEALPTNSDEYVLRNIAVACPDCSSIFTTPSLVQLPPVAEDDQIEGDLHRVLPDAALRSALIAVCPYCNFATWTARCQQSPLNPEIFPIAEQIGHSKKFALAVKHARAKAMDPLDIAFIAINGLYCAREAGENDDLWLELAAYEQSRGLNQEFAFLVSAQDHLLMAELWRQLKCFDKALPEYELAAKDEFIPRELLEHLTMAARNGQHQPILLPPHVVRAVFPDALPARGAATAKKERRVPKAIVRVEAENKLEQFFSNIPPDRRQSLSADNDEFAYEDGAEEETTVEMNARPELYAVDAESAFEYAASAQEEVLPVEQSLPEPSQNSADTSAPAAQTGETPATANNPVPADPFERVRKLVAMPQGASSVSLVQAAPTYGAMPSVTVAASPSQMVEKKEPQKAERLEAHLPPMQPPSEYLPNATNPDKSVAAHAASQRALRRAMKAAQEEGDKFPEIQITDEESGYAYTAAPAVEQPDEEETAPAQPAAQQAQGAQQANPQDAVARVESFLSLTRQPAYQSWIRGYRK